MEAIRQRMINDAQKYPEFGAPRKPSSADPPSVVSISSTSSPSPSPENPFRKQKSQRAVVISDDDDSSDEVEIKPAEKPVKMPEPQPYYPPAQPRPHVMLSELKDKAKEKVETKMHNLFGSRDPVPVPVPSQDSYKPSQIPGHYQPGGQPMPVLSQDDNAYMAPADTEKALRDLMSGGIADDDNAEINEEDAYVPGFKEDVKLLPHQIQGRFWMKDREDPSKKRFGGILADDMGLGKTIQTLTRIVEGRPRKSDKDEWDAPTLVVCPLAVLGQWHDEIKKMAKGSLTVIKHQGTSRTKDAGKLRHSHIVITTYDTVRSEFQAFSPEVKDETKSKSKSAPSSKSTSTSSKGVSESNSDSDSSFEHFERAPKKGAKKPAKKVHPLFEVRWWRIVLDEAHTIKNRNARVSLACCELEGKYRWCLTGTPMQNDVLELFSLIKFLGVKPLNDFHTFNEQIAKPVKNGRGGVRAMKRLHVVLKNIMLRRTKDRMINGKALLDLPPRNVESVSCPFDAAEREFYFGLEGRMSSVIEDMTRKENATFIGALVLLLRLRQACDHPLLVSKDYKSDLDALDPKAAKKGSDGTNDGDDLANAFGQMSVSRTCALCTTPLTERNTGSSSDRHCHTCQKIAIQAKSMDDARPSSAKIRMILKLLDDIEKRSDGVEKTIIFSQFTSMLDLVEPFLKNNGTRFVRYDGSMQAQQRETSLEKIKQNPDIRVILISFKSGSTGLNLTACNNVILVDPWWNPALEDQAFDRAHRFGQQRPVFIYKLKIDNTVEERILELQDKKREMTKAALSGDKVKNMRLGMDELLALFRPGGRDDDEEDYV